MSFENNIQKWVAVDNQLKVLNDKMKTLRETRNTLTGDITNYAETFFDVAVTEWAVNCDEV